MRDRLRIETDFVCKTMKNQLVLIDPAAKKGAIMFIES
jgi:hypothetical protein